MKSYISVVLISALLIASLFFALPKTESLFSFVSDQRFDLNKKEDTYWKQEFILELGIEQKDKVLTDKKINDAKNILYKRLQKAGVEEIQIVNYEPTKEEIEGKIYFGENKDYLHEYLKITIQTTKSEDLINRLVTSTGRVKIMEPKENLQELAEEDFMQSYMETNYNETKWNRDEFRNILINDLMSGQGERSYYAIFKPKVGNRGDFSKFLEENEGQSIGVLMDNFVMPIQITQEMGALFAVSIGPETGEAQVQNIILNTGVIPVAEMSLFSTKEVEPTLYEVDHIQVILAILISTFSVIFFLYKKEKEDKEMILQFAFSLLLIFSISLTVLKIWQVPVDLFLLIPTGILGIIFLKSMYTCVAEAKMILIMSVIVAALMSTIGTGYAPILGTFLLFVILLSFVTEILTKIYFKNIKIINN